jgi:hypothetical protein
VGLERGPLSLVSTIEELLGRNNSDSGLESREYGHRIPSHCPRGTLYLQKFTLTSPTSGTRSVGIVCSRTKATEFGLVSRAKFCFINPDYLLIRITIPVQFFDVSEVEVSLSCPMK